MVFVEIRNKATGKVEKRMGPMAERRADRVHDGACINLNHAEYEVVIVPDTAAETDITKIRIQA